GYKSQVVLKAQGEVARFNELLPQYLAAPDLTRERIYLETMEELYQNTNKVVVDMPAGNNSMIYLPLDKLSGKPAAVQPAAQPGAATATPAAPSNEGANSTPTPLRGGDRLSSGRN
ncbi:MAG: FtsH protease activity modulator HflK, partial [Aeromonas sp.]